MLQHYPKDFYPGLYVRAIFWSKVARHTPGFNPFFAPFASSEVFDHILNKPQKSRCQTRHSNTGHKTQKSSMSECRFSWCYLSKDLGRVNHKLLLKEIHRFGIRGTLLSWFEDYLTDRVQRVTVFGVNSPCVITCAVRINTWSTLVPHICKWSSWRGVLNICCSLCWRHKVLPVNRKHGE